MRRALLVCFCILLLGGGGIAVWKVGLPYLEALEAEQKAAAAAPDPQYVALDPFIVPLIREGAVAEHLTLAIELEVRNEAGLVELRGRLPELRDAFVTELFGLYSLRYVQEHADNVQFTKKRLLDVGAELLGEGVVTGVLVTGIQARELRPRRG